MAIQHGAPKINACVLCVHIFNMEDAKVICTKFLGVDKTRNTELSRTSRNIINAQKKKDKKIKDNSRDCSATFKPNLEFFLFMHARALGADILHLEQKTAFGAVLFLIIR